ncbi:2-amino-4-hydroxy-6-hydroxymethyldihydropteridinediphosphokinase [Tangfeifania diversioriginum]|uniref:2-amino-4-hydroxy-6-hydroxymethyldihydropteridine pyrophosphokinase n=2 Tax=Tangfeifania diversioriginum TaxID=1168035 RepID=A0A1M6AF22_9BACT|nr:2-amino-4-hydroxy-6-hydroxymethyldihydropteridinediphosphokinase [Tangfeifania diversioriginum]
MDLTAGYYYHVFNRGNNSNKIFFTRDNYLFFLRKMNELISPYASFLSWCLMPNHFHWVIYIRRESHTLTQSEGMTKQRTINQSIGILLRSYTRAIQKQQNLSGSLFQKHTKSKALIDEIEIEPSYWDSAFGTIINIPEGKNYLETCIEYVHQNPVYSGLVNNADEWEFSSFRDYIGLRKGKLIDYDLLRKENIIFHAQEKSHTLTQSEGMTTNTSIISIGSNIDAEINISKMLEILGNEVEIIKVSSMLKTKPIGIENQPDFTNGVVKISTSRSKKDLKSLLKAIENQLGRNRKGPKFGPRTMDLDIVVWNGKIVDEDYYTRDFLRQSIDEIGGY